MSFITTRRLLKETITSPNSLNSTNAGATVNLEGCSFSQGVTHTFESITFEAGSYLVVAVNASSYSSLSATVIEWSSGGLSNSGESVTLVDPSGVIIDTVTYDDGSGWPAALTVVADPLWN